ncbi:hypothetical protein FMEXI_5069 [Fusarium mexicanum]|uniref:Uncharacterized protein n=1 Tax=Fusarium mexicanum TaxID=751941 RepID=A0A8H5J518_9HYPO|nr:hypothetical protein FMEXI_5069 [Fusarium mexicanum]
MSCGKQAQHFRVGGAFHGAGHSSTELLITVLLLPTRKPRSYPLAKAQVDAKGARKPIFYSQSFRNCSPQAHYPQSTSQQFRTENHPPKAMTRLKRRKVEAEAQDHSMIKAEVAEGRESAVEVQNRILRAEVKLLRDSIMDLRVALDSKTELIEELRQSRDAEREKKRLLDEPITRSG